MYLKRILFAVLMVLAFAGYAEAQGTIYNLSPPAPNAQLRVCPSPDNGYPCPVTAAIFSDVGLTQSIAQPVQLGPSGFATFYIAAGTYVIQLSGPGYGAGNRQTVTIGGGGGGFPVTSAAAVGTGGSISVTPGTNGSIAGVQVAAPPMAFYLSPQCPTGNTSICFYTPADTQLLNNSTCAWTSGGSSVTACPANTFTAADIGKRIIGYVTFGAGIQSSATNALTQALTTSSQLVIATQAGTSVTFTGGTAAFTGGGSIAWGHTDDTGAAAVDTAMQAAAQCPKLFLAAAYYLFTVPHWFTQPTSCKSLPTVGGQAFGDVLFAGGMEIEGRGRGNTVLVMTPGFPETGSCTNGSHANACWVRTLMGEWRDFQLTGLLNSQGVASTNLISFQGPGALQNFTCTNWGNGQTNTNGFYVIGWDRWDNVDNSGCGGTALSMNPPTDQIQLVCVHCSFENSPSELTIVGTGGGGADFSCWDCYFYEGLGSTGKIIWSQGGRMLFSRTSINFLANATTTVGYLTTATNGSILWAHDLTFIAPGTLSGDINCNSGATCQVFLQNTIFNATGGTITSGNAGDQFVDEGGNLNIQSGNGASGLTGQYFNEALSMNQTDVTAPKLVLSGGWGTTAAVTALTGGNAPIQFTVTNSGTGQGASPTIVYTFPTKWVTAPFSCTATQVGGTNATGTFTASVPSATAVTFTFSLTPTAASTEIVQVACTTP